MTDLSVVIVTFNGARWIEACLRPLTDRAADFEIIVVDNASRDDTVQRVRDQFPRIRILRMEHNLGFGAGCNRGVAAARSPYCLLVNQDVIARGSPGLLVEEMARDPSLAVLGGRLEYPGGAVQKSIGRERTPGRILLSWIFPSRFPVLGPLFARVEPCEDRYTSPQRGVPWVSGSFMLVRKRVWEEFGGMAPEYFMHVEDVDFCRRVREGGYAIGYSPACSAIHLERGGRRALTRGALLWTAAGYCRFLRRFHPRFPIRSFQWMLAGAFLTRGILLRLTAVIPPLRQRAAAAEAFLEVGGRLLRDDLPAPTPATPAPGPPRPGRPPRR